MKFPLHFDDSDYSTCRDCGADHDEPHSAACADITAARHAREDREDEIAADFADWDQGDDA